MLLRTHLALSGFFILLFLPKVNYEFTLIILGILATLLPDIDHGYSRVGKHALFRPLQWFTRHRGMLHSYTSCFIGAFALALINPIWGLPFFLGYGVHLFGDAFTPEGIQPFWPYRGVSKGPLKTGSFAESVLFVGFVLADLAMLVMVIA